MNFELPPKELRRLAAAALLLICAANSKPILPLPLDSPSASVEANKRELVVDSLNRAGVTAITNLTIDSDFTFTFNKTSSQIQEKCMGYYQEHDDTYISIGALVCG